MSTPLYAPIDLERLPRHVAIIMDGNGRWAKQHKVKVAMGHRTGTETLRAICGAVSIPVNAIGGLNRDNLHVLAGIPIAGICAVSAIMKADNPKEAAVGLKAKAKELGLI